MQVDSSTLLKENHTTLNNQLVVYKGGQFHSYYMPLGLGPLTYFLMSKENKLLANQQQFEVLHQDKKYMFTPIISLKYPITYSPLSLKNSFIPTPQSKHLIQF